MNNSGESGHPCLVPDLRGNALSFSPLRIMFAVWLTLYVHITAENFAAAAAAARSLQSCPTLCDPIDGSPPGSPPGSPVLGILQARTLEWVAISFSNA